VLYRWYWSPGRQTVIESLKLSVLCHLQTSNHQKIIEIACKPNFQIKFFPNQILARMAALSTAQQNVEQEYLDCARYDESAELCEFLGANPTISINTPSTLLDSSYHNGNTPLHYACANGNVEVVEVILRERGDEVVHRGNKEGNTPLHWCACNAGRNDKGDEMTDGEDKSATSTNPHVLCAVSLMKHPTFTIDVCLQNSAGRSALTEAFQSDNKEMIKLLLEHESASEERLLMGINEEKLTEKERREAAVTHEFDFLDGLGTPKRTKMKARELPMTNADDPFTTEAKDDTTGYAIWAASLVLASYLARTTDKECGRVALELGAGCGVPGLAVANYWENTEKIYITDLNKVAVENLEFNRDLMMEGREDQRKQEELSEERLVKKEEGSTTPRVRPLLMDWDKLDDFNAESIDLLIGADLVYSPDIVPLLKKVVKHLLATDGVFVYCAPALTNSQRNGLEEFVKSMKSGTKGWFKCRKETFVERGGKSEFSRNPLVGGDDDTGFAFFNELYEKDFVVYEFVKVQR